MRADNCQPFFDFYTKNKNCQMLILKRGNSLIGRAIIWETNYNGQECSFEYMMDRVYTNNPSDVLKFHDYAKEKGWSRKFKNTYSDELSIVLNDQKFISKIKFQLDTNIFELYPFADTFKYYNPITYEVQNFHPKVEGFSKLENTNGSCSIIYLV